MSIAIARVTIKDDRSRTSRSVLLWQEVAKLTENRRLVAMGRLHSIRGFYRHGLCEHTQNIGKALDPWGEIEMETHRIKGELLVTKG